MATKVSDVANTDVSSDYPDGQIRDEAGLTAGTPLVAQLYRDVVQAFQKLMRSAGIAYNSLPDNETNGYQFLDAMNYVNDDRYKYATRISSVAEWNAYSNNLNLITTPGYYNLAGDTTTKLNMPANELGYGAYLTVIRDRPSGTIVQEFVTMANGGGRGVYVREYVSGAWQPWRTIYAGETTWFNVSVGGGAGAIRYRRVGNVATIILTNVLTDGSDTLFTLTLPEMIPTYPLTVSTPVNTSGGAGIILINNTTGEITYGGSAGVINAVITYIVDQYV